jgi:hypothetical protein
VFTDWYAAGRRAQQLVRLSPRRKRFLGEAGELARDALFADCAVRNSRVIARRAEAILLDIRETPAADARIQALAQATETLAGVIRQVADETRRGRSPQRLREAVVAAAAGLDADLAGASWQPRAYVLLLRSMTIDVLQACGLPRDAARAAMPSIEGFDTAT